MSEEITKPTERDRTCEQSVEKTEVGFYETYANLARNLRTWFIAYGIGGPVIFLTNKSVSDALISTGMARFVASLFLGGVLLQILVAMLYKTAMWYLYMGELEIVKKTKRRYKASEWLSNQYWIEFFFDIGTIVLFGWATLTALRSITL